MVKKLNRIYNEDVFEFLNSLDNESVDLAIVDPPYNQGVDEWDLFENEEEYFNFTFKWLDLLLKKIKKTGSFYLFNNVTNSAIIFNYLKEKDAKYRNWVIWHKKDGFSSSKRKFVNNQEVILFYSKTDSYTFNADDVRIPYDSTERIKAAIKKGIIKNGKRWFPNPRGKLCPDVWDFTSHRHKNKINGKTTKFIHSTPKPELLIERIVLASSNQNDLVLDLFSGSGTTSYIAKKLKRNFVGCEKNYEYFKFANKRIDGINYEKRQ